MMRRRMERTMPLVTAIWGRIRNPIPMIAAFKK
jgi:hypothetical protein